MTALVILVILSLAGAAPVTNTPTNIPPLAEPSYVAEPKGRGTVRLFLSCVITLVICIWTAVHPNIIRNPTLTRRLWNKAIYVILGLFSPELILALALQEWRDAARFLKHTQLAGAAAYAESEAQRVRALMIEKEEPAGEGSRARAAVETALINVDRAVSAARKEEKDARVELNAYMTKNIKEAANPSARMSDSDEMIPRVFTYHIYGAQDYYKKAGGKQRAALDKARDLRTAFEEYEIENRTANLSWISKAYDTLQMYLVRVAQLCWGTEDAWDRKYRGIGRENAYFAIMGGYTFCPVKGLPNPVDEFTLAPNALAFLLRQRFITTTELASHQLEIADKGKSDMLAKFLVCVQALWMVFNCLSRKIAGLPLTLLELNVMMHVLCALVVYICWWKKPHDAGRPLSLSHTLLDHDSWALVYTMHKYGPLLRCSLKEPEPLKETLTTAIDTSRALNMIEEHPPTSVESPTNNRGFTLEPNDHSTPTEGDLAICASAARKMRQLIEDGSGFVCRIPGQYPLCTPRVEMLYDQSSFQVAAGSSWLLILLCLAYGGVHVTAWNSHFPTPIERTLWRISCLVVGTPGMGIFAFDIARTLSDRKQRKEFIKVILMCAFILVICILSLSAFGGSIYGMVFIAGRPSTPLGGFLLFLLILVFIISFVAILVLVGFCLCHMCVSNWISSMGHGLWELLSVVAMPVAFIYCGARAYIVVESFISMRSLPVGAYSTFSWENYWPHI